MPNPATSVLPAGVHGDALRPSSATYMFDGEVI
jgi:hypothetical protein